MKAVFEKKADLRFSAKHICGLKPFPPMFHTHCELVYILDGQVKIMIDGHEYHLEPGNLALIFPYVVHSYESAPDAKAYLCMFDPSSVQLFEGDLLSRKPVVPHITDGSSFAPLLKKITELSAANDAYSQRIAISYLGAMIGELLNDLSLCDVETTPDNMIKPILNYCYEHFADEDISIKKVADALYISDSYVSKVFCSKLKYNFREYINTLRISHAKKLLSETDIRIVDIMLECGYKNQSSFNRIFYNIVNTAPTEYRSAKKSRK